MTIPSDSNVPYRALLVQQGDDIEINMVYKSGNPPAPLNLTGAKVRMDIVAADGSVLRTLNSDSADGPTEITLGSDGSIHIVLPRAVTISGELSTHLKEKLHYDIFLRKVSGLQRKILQGVVIVQPSTTKWT